MHAGALHLAPMLRAFASYRTVSACALAMSAAVCSAAAALSSCCAMRWASRCTAASARAVSSCCSSRSASANPSSLRRRAVGWLPRCRRGTCSWREAIHRRMHACRLDTGSAQSTVVLLLLMMLQLTECCREVDHAPGPAFVLQASGRMQCRGLQVYKRTAQAHDSRLEGVMHGAEELAGRQAHTVRRPHRALVHKGDGARPRQRQGFGRPDGALRWCRRCRLVSVRRARPCCMAGMLLQRQRLLLHRHDYVGWEAHGHVLCRPQAGTGCCVHTAVACRHTDGGWPGKARPGGNDDITHVRTELSPTTTTAVWLWRRAHADGVCP